MAASEKREDQEVREERGNSYSRSLDEYLDRKQAAAYIGYSEHYLHRKACDPSGPPYKRIGRKAWYRRVDLDAHVIAEKERRGLHHAETTIDSHVTAKPPAYAFAAAFGQSSPIGGAPQSGVLHVDSLEGSETWPDGVYICGGNVLIKRSRWP